MKEKARNKCKDLSKEEAKGEFGRNRYIKYEKNAS